MKKMIELMPIDQDDVIYGCCNLAVTRFSLRTGMESDGEVCGPNADGSTDFIQFTASIEEDGSYTCGLHSDGSVTCWGPDGSGQVSGVPR